MDSVPSGFFDNKTIVILGVSSSKMKFGSMAYRALKKGGYKVFGVNPRLETIDGDRCYRSLGELPEPVETAIVVVKPASAATLISDAVKAGVKRIWFQQGANFSALADRAREQGLEVMTDKCALMYAEPVRGIHSFHKFFAKLFKKY